MKTKFNYVIYIILLFVLVGFLTALACSPKFFNIIVHAEKNKVAVIVGLVFGVLGVIYAIVVLVDLLLNYRYIIEPTRGGIMVTDIILRKKIIIDFPFIKAIQEDDYIYSMYLEAITVTLKTGKTYKMLNFFLWNYSVTKKALKTVKRKVRLHEEKLISKKNS